MDPFYDLSAYLPGHGGGVLPVSDHSNASLGQEYLLSDSGALSPIGTASGHGTSSGTGTSSSSSAPAPTLVAANGSNLHIDLVWDKSVASAPSGFTAAVIAAAQTYVNDFTSSAKTVLYIDVGWGEVAGSSLASNALGESESSGYLTNYATVTHALSNDGYSFTASNEPTSGQFFVTSAQAKALGLISGTSGGLSSVDGYVGFSTLSGTGYSWNLNATGTTSSQFNLQAVADHEISEVMGRIGMEGTAVYNGHKTYTPLDLFNLSAPGVLELSGQGGYFSTNNGVTKMGSFNDAAKYGGDIADWASYSSISQSGTLSSGSDAFDAFDYPGYNGSVSADDLLVVASLGYKLTSGAKLA
jgi:hypothetical protein